MTGTTYQQYVDKYRNDGFILDHIDSYGVGNEVRYAAIWTKSGGAFTAYHGKTSAEHQESFDSLTSQGWSPKVISGASVQGKVFYTALYTKQAIGNFEPAHSLPPRSTRPSSMKTLLRQTSPLPEQLRSRRQTAFHWHLGTGTQSVRFQSEPRAERR